MITRWPLMATAWVRVLAAEAWWHRDNTLASHGYGPGSSPGC